MADHWYWRPGWHVGRRFYTWHFTFQDRTELHAHAASYRQALADFPTLDLVPDRWLHLTTQGVGFVDEVDQGDVDAIVQAAVKRLAALAPFTLEFAAPVPASEGVAWRLDTAAVSPVRDAIRAAVGDVLAEVPEAAEGFAAHVSLAYANAGIGGGPVDAALAKVDAAPVMVPVDRAELIVLHRDHRMYAWETYAAVPLGGA
jgi:hypothetical protein